MSCQRNADLLILGDHSANKFVGLQDKQVPKAAVAVDSSQVFRPEMDKKESCRATNVLLVSMDKMNHWCTYTGPPSSGISRERLALLDAPSQAIM